MPSGAVGGASWDGAMLAPSHSGSISHVDIVIYSVQLPIGHGAAGYIALGLPGWPFPPDGRPRRRSHGMDINGDFEYILYSHPSRLLIPVYICKSLSEMCSVGLWGSSY